MGSMKGPSFLSVAQWDRRKERCPGRATERCERDFLRLVFRVSNSNEIQETNRRDRAKQRTSRLARTAYHLSMRRPRPESADSDINHHSVAADALMRQEPDEDEEEDDGDSKEDSDADEENDEGYSE
jgi:hypothetical protein